MIPSPTAKDSWKEETGSHLHQWIYYTVYAYGCSKMEFLDCQKYVICFACTVLVSSSELCFDKWHKFYVTT